MSDSSSPYTVLARRCRPQSFDEVVGQEHVSQAIQNAIRGGRVAHAYLFTGARGVGKTSTARIFAKALNCPNVQDGVPCNQCEICRGISAGNDVDVLEIDGASNRGIDDIRQLRANVSIRSMRSPNKVYIIDEVHMLTKEAFNALLKTLEEPPPNVKFVFCTTEPNKVPDTILSRCQRFDFGTISQSSIATRLRQIADGEGKQVDDEAIELVARRAAGSMRDSQSLFDQLLAFGSDRITAEDVHRLLGTASDERLINLVDCLIQGRHAEALQTIEAALQQGVQIGSFSDQLLAYLRDLLVTAAGAREVSLSAVTETSRPRVAEQATAWGLQTISAAMQILAETKVKMQRATAARALLELAIVRMASLEQLDQIATIAQQLATGAISPAGAGSPRPGAIADRPGTTAASAALKKNFEQQSAERRPPVAPVAPPAPVPDPQLDRAPPPEEAMQLLPTGSNGRRHEPPSEGPPPNGNTTSGPLEQGAYLPLSAQELDRIWERLRGEVPEKLREHLANVSRRAISGPNRLEILFPRSYLFSKSYCENAESLKKLHAAVCKITGQAVECRIGIDAAAEVAAPPPPARAEKSRLVERRKNSSLDNDTFVQMAVGIFGGQVVEVRPLLDTNLASDAAAPGTEEDEES